MISVAMHGMIVGVALLFALALPGCALETPSDPELSALTKEQLKAVYEYVDCVNSRFPLHANRYAYVTDERVADKLHDGSLDFAGMDITYYSLGCGNLMEEN